MDGKLDSQEPIEGETDPADDLMAHIMKDQSIVDDKIEYRMVVGQEWAYNFNNVLSTKRPDSPLKFKSIIPGAEPENTEANNEGAEKIALIKTSLNEISQLLMAEKQT